MKNKINKIKLALLVLLTPLFIVNCQDDDEWMVSEVVDMNDRITGMDKEVTEPGDVVTFSGTNLGKVYKIMLNTESTPVEFEATATELKMTIPAAAPLGDVITVNILFSGKGLARRALKIISPPEIYTFSPGAGHAGDVLNIFGRELYLTTTANVGGITAIFTIIDDKQMTVTLPDGFTGGDIVLVSETGSESSGPQPVIPGTELLITNVDENGSILSSYGPYSNASGEIANEGFPRGDVYTITIEDNGSSWGANCDFSFSGLPAEINGTPIDISKVEMHMDVKASKTLSVNFMIGDMHNPSGGVPAGLWGRSRQLSQNWQTFIIPMTDLGYGYDDGPATPVEELYPAFDKYTMLKWSLPAQASAGNFGETITFDNIKFIIRD
jgi:hypothetical protein